MKDKKIAFVWDFSVKPVEMYSWNDGLNQALKILAEEHGHYVKVICHDQAQVIYDELREFKPDLIIGWGSLDRPSFAGLRQFKVPTALCFAGGPTDHPHTSSFDVIFVENDEYLEAFKKQGVNAVKAFGTNDSLFRPLALPKNFLACYPATFAKWKRHELFARSVKEDGIAVGKINTEEMECFKVCTDNGVTVLSDIPYVAIPLIYNQSKFTLVTATNYGGSQRAVLESMACNVVPIVMSDNTKCCEYVKDSGYGIIVEPKVEAIQEVLLSAIDNGKDETGRKYIKAKYSAKGYADSIQAGLAAI